VLGEKFFKIGPGSTSPQALDQPAGA